MGGRLIAWLGLVLTLALSFGLAAPADATFPGKNGKLAAAKDGDIYVMNPDGSGQENLTADTAGSRNWPAWSPDGSKLAFSGDGIWTMNADGSGKTLLTGTTPHGMPVAPAWSPDGSEIVVLRAKDSTCLVGRIEYFCSIYSLHVMNSNGSGEHIIDSGPGVLAATWSPDGSKIAFGDCLGDSVPCYESAVCTKRPDGTGKSCRPLETDVQWHLPDWKPDGTRLIALQDPYGCCDPSDLVTFEPDFSDQTSLGVTEWGGPVWSPDETKIAFGGRYSGGIHTANSDGTGKTLIAADFDLPDWQPIPINAYPRPVGASPVEVSLVPAYQPCSAPNRTHGPPLGFGSCSPPTQQPGQLTVGTPDANGQGANSLGYLRIGTLPGNPTTPADEADVRLWANITDVRMRSDLSDYTGDLEARLAIQITDKNNTPHPGGPGAATVQELTHSHPIPCAATANTNVGSTCQVDTTVEALVPGAVVEKRRAIWELGAVRVHDGAGNLFMTQGLFVP